MSEHGLLLVNLGSPPSPREEDVRRYLDQFLMDPYVIDIPRVLRRLLVSLILWRRTRSSSHAYQSIWQPEGSPLRIISEQLKERIKPLWSKGPVCLAMRYGQPAIVDQLHQLADQGIKTLTLAPLYPQFADSTVTTVVEEVRKAIRKNGFSFSVLVLPPFYEHGLYIEALADSLQDALEGDYDHLLFSFHGIPERHIRKLVKERNHDLNRPDSKGVPDHIMAYCYRSQCLRTAELVTQRLGLGKERWSVSFQSRLGKEKWIGPYTDKRLDELAAAGTRKLRVACPAFVADCLETLEEIGIRGREQFRAAGGEELTLIPCLNDDTLWAENLVNLCEQTAVPLKA